MREINDIKSFLRMNCAHLQHLHFVFFLVVFRDPYGLLFFVRYLGIAVQEQFRLRFLRFQFLLGRGRELPPLLLGAF